MKTLVITLALALSLTACTQSTQYGDCVGVANQQNPKLRYEISWWNAFVAALFSETMIVPIVTVAYDIQCPVGERE